MYTINDKEIIARYKSSKSMRAVAAYYDISTQTVRRVLISYGILPEGRTTEIANLTRSGLSKDEIAARLKIHPKTVLSHCPYTKISYRTGKKTQNALNIQRYRMRKKAKCISSQQVIQEGANIMFNPDFHPPKYIHYSYGESVALDVSRYISKHININDWPNRDAPEAIEHDASSMVALVDVDTLKYREETDTRAVRKNVSMPAWLLNMADARGINCSQVLQDALKRQLGFS